MWRFAPILLLLAAGCAKTPPPQPVVVVYQDRPAAALAYAAPAGSVDLGSVLDRELREPTAFIGYSSGFTEFYWLRTDDRMRFGGRSGRSGFFGVGNQDRFERRAVSTRVGVLER